MTANILFISNCCQTNHKYQLYPYFAIIQLNKCALCSYSCPLLVVNICHIQTKTIDFSALNVSMAYYFLLFLHYIEPIYTLLYNFLL